MMKMKGNLLIILASAFFLTNAAAYWARHTLDPVSSLSTTGVVNKQSGEQVGDSTLFRNGEGLEFIMNTRGLQPGETFSVWLILNGDDGDDGTLMVNAGRGLADRFGNGSFAGRLSVGPLEAVIPGEPGPLDTIVRNGGVLSNPMDFDVKLAIVPHGAEDRQEDPCGDQTVDLLACADIWESQHLK